MAEDAIPFTPTPPAAVNQPAADIVPFTPSNSPEVTPEQWAAEEPDHGEITATTKMQKAAIMWEHATFGLFSAGPKHTRVTPGVKVEWADVPHYAGGMAVETLLNPGNMLTGIFTGGAAPVVKSVAGKAIGAYMLASTAKEVPNLYSEVKSKDVTSAQKFLDVGATAAQGFLGVKAMETPLSYHVSTATERLGQAMRALPKQQADVLMDNIRGKSPGRIAEELQKLAAENPDMEAFDHLNAASRSFQKIEAMEPKEVKELHEAQQAFDEVKKLMAPQTRGPQAEIAAGALREMGADLAQRLDRAEAALDKSSKTLMSMPPSERWASVDAIEGGRPQANEELQTFADTAREMMDSRRQELQQMGKMDQFIEDYFPHIWKDPEQAAKAFKSVMAKTPLEGPKSFLKQRTIPTIAEGRALGLEPVSDNPVDLLLLKAREMDRFILAQKWFEEMKGKGLVEFVRAGERPPEGYIPINDKIATVYGPRQGAVRFSPDVNELTIQPEDVTVLGSRVMGQYYAPDQVATVANNYLSPGLRKSALFRGYMTLSNSLNRFQLGLSAFHLGFTSVDTSISKLALALEYGAEGKPLKAAAKVAQVPTAPITNFLQGNKVLKEWMRPGTQGAEVGKIVEAIKRAGGRAQMDRLYQTTITKNMMNAWKTGRTMSAIWRAPFAAMEQVTRPLMEYIVPRQKMGVAADLMRAEMERLPENASIDRQRAAFGKAWDSVDNRMGQLVYDNLFWNKTIKDLSMATVRAVGWDLGTIREIGGGMVDTAKLAKKLTTRGSERITSAAIRVKGKVYEGANHKAIRETYGVTGEEGFVTNRGNFVSREKAAGIAEKAGQLKEEKPDQLHSHQVEMEAMTKDERLFTHRMAYTISLPFLTGLLGALYQYLRTGKGPEELRDYFFPKTGEKDPQGRDVRMTMPTYMKDVYHYAHAPWATIEGKVSPFPAAVVQMLNNKDFFGRDIRNADDPLVKQMMDEATYFAKQWQPIGVQQFQQQRAAKVDTVESVGAFVGVTRAPTWVGETAAEQLAAKLAGDKFKSSKQPDMERAQAVKDIMSELRSKDEEKVADAYARMAQMIEEGTLTPQQRRNIIKGTDHTFLENQVGHLDANEAMRVFRAANASERATISEAVKLKILRAHLSTEDKEQLLSEFEKLDATLPERDPTTRRR